MSYDFNANDIFEMAERIEENGVLYYEKAAKLVINKEYVNFLLDLANMEKNHKLFFSKMRKKLQEFEIEETIFDPYSESSLYIKAFADVHIFFERKINFNSIKSVLEEGILIEKDSIIFYLNMKKLVPSRMGSDKLDNIIWEEMKHINILSDKLIKLKK